MKKTVGIIGLGLMGGSLALELKKMPTIKRIVGLDLNSEHEQQALALDLVDDTVDFNTLQQCDIIFLTIPVEAIIATLKRFDSLKKDTTIIDFGSTKSKIVANIPQAIRQNFVAAHPMTGTEKFGPSAAQKNLYVNKVVVLCDKEKSGTLQQDIAKELFEFLKMNIVHMSAKEHDLHVAYISHLPHALSYALANSVLAHQDRHDILNLAAGGFRDMSRLAKSSPQMWEDIFRQNRDNLLQTIEAFELEFQALKCDIQAQNWESLRARMIQANSLHDIL